MTDKNIPNALAVIGALSGRGRDYTRARNAFIVREALLGTKQADVVKGTGVDKGDVSRLFKLASTIGKRTALHKSILALSLSNVNVDNYATVAGAAELGKSFERQGKQSTGAAKGKGQGGASPVPSPESGLVRVKGDDGKSADRDVLEVTFEWLTADYANRLPLVQAMLANAETFVATNTAEADAQAS